MAKYRKQRLPARAKRRTFDTHKPIVGEGQSYVDALSRSQIQVGLQQALEQERDEIVGRGWHAHQTEGVPVQYRNGYAQPRCLTCGSGTVQVEMPRLRQRYDSKIVAKYERLTPEVQKLIPQLYLHGLALGDFQQAFGWLWGEEAPLSQASILRCKQQWEEQYQQWKKQPLGAEYLYVWADGIYPKGGAVDETLALLTIVAVNREGRKTVLALEEGYRESEESWTDLFRELKRRGVTWIGLVIGDGIPGLWKAVRTVFPTAWHQRCWVHKMRNVLDKVPKKIHDEVLDQLRLIYYATSLHEALRLRQAFIQQYRTAYPKAVQSLLEASEALFTYFRFPRKHWVHLKTTNPIESLFATVRLRTRAARRLRTRMGTVCLVFQLLKTNEPRLRRIRAYTLVPDIIEQTQSQQLRKRRAA